MATTTRDKDLPRTSRRAAKVGDAVNVHSSAWEGAMPGRVVAVEDHGGEQQVQVDVDIGEMDVKVVQPIPLYDPVPLHFRTALSRERADEKHPHGFWAEWPPAA